MGALSCIHGNPSIPENTLQFLYLNQPWATGHRPWTLQTIPHQGGLCTKKVFSPSQWWITHETAETALPHKHQSILLKRCCFHGNSGARGCSKSLLLFMEVQGSFPITMHDGGTASISGRNLWNFWSFGHNAYKEEENTQVYNIGVWKIYWTLCNNSWIHHRHWV